MTLPQFTLRALLIAVTLSATHMGAYFNGYQQGMHDEGNSLQAESIARMLAYDTNEEVDDN